MGHPVWYVSSEVEVAVFEALRSIAPSPYSSLISRANSGLFTNLQNKVREFCTLLKRRKFDKNTLFQFECPEQNKKGCEASMAAANMWPFTVTQRLWQLQMPWLVGQDYNCSVKDASHPQEWLNWVRGCSSQSLRKETEHCNRNKPDSYEQRRKPSSEHLAQCL